MSRSTRFSLMPIKESTQNVDKNELQTLFYFAKMPSTLSDTYLPTVLNVFHFIHPSNNKKILAILFTLDRTDQLKNSYDD